MATAEPASVSLGPRYAPEDPTLPKPWMGLIDGSTGLLYYWNPETNVTQYEKPASLPPPLPPGPPPTSTPKLAQIPMAHSVQPSGLVAQTTLQQGQQSSQLPQQAQATQQQGQQSSPLPQQHGQLMPQQQVLPVAQVSNQQVAQQGSQLGQGVQQPVHLRTQMMQHPGQQMLSNMGQQISQQGVQQQQQAIQQSSHQVGQHMLQHQNLQCNNHKTATPSSQNLYAGGDSVLTPQAVAHVGQPQQFSGSAVNMQQSSSVAQLQQSGADLVHQQHGPPFQNHFSPSMMHNQQSNVPPVGLTVGSEMNIHGRAGSDYYFNPKVEGPIESRMGGVTFQNVTTGYAGGFNAAGHTMHNMYNHAIGGGPFPNNALIRPPFVGTSDVTNLSPAEVYRREHEVTATGDNVPAPFITFEATGFPPEILRDIHAAGFLSPTPIQAQTWPIALQNRDTVAIAKTGSVLYGGAPKGPQLKELDRGADIVVATPGRLNDILEMKKINFGQVSLLVLDEADRMLDMGFEPQIRKIVNEIPPRRQTLMYTATWPKEVRKIASDLLVNPVQVNIGSVDELAANKSITQYVEVVPQMEKERRLEQILRAQERGSKVIIFCSTKRLCDQLARSIGRNFGAAVIHGDKSQGERDWVLNQFRNGKSPILVATDVAARGLDIKDIRVVINYDFPTGIEDYVHRIGRTGRAGATGVSYTFFSEQDWKYAADLVKVLEGANQHVPPEGWQLWDVVGMRDGGFGFRGGVRDGPFGGYGGRNDSFSGRGNRGRGYSGHAGWGRNERGLHDRHNNMDGRGRGRGRGRFDGRREIVDRVRDRSYSRSPERVRTLERPHESNFDKKDVTAPEFEAPKSGMSPMSPGTHGNAFSGVEGLPAGESAVPELVNPEAAEGQVPEA
ncbi:hypothetical protein GH714_010905 [Hevea brasiliensis]|uniref:RNA helicase n=1 Tax=Hevea brasiliensis TaxID=3981 RepID=A0A6A6LPD7_HEVBR|nr:hypothetical protein GH714_010905 [Hevea brasiliensis]